MSIKRKSSLYHRKISFYTYRERFYDGYFSRQLQKSNHQRDSPSIQEWVGRCTCLLVKLKLHLENTILKRNGKIIASAVVKYLKGRPEDDRRLLPNKLDLFLEKVQGKL